MTGAQLTLAGTTRTWRIGVYADGCTWPGCTTHPRTRLAGLGSRCCLHRVRARTLADARALAKREHRACTPGDRVRADQNDQVLA